MINLRKDNCREFVSLAVFVLIIFFGYYGTAESKTTETSHDKADKYFREAIKYKLAGSILAQDYYEKAIATDPDNPEYNLGYADYLRNFRGPYQQPLFYQAERNYYDALTKIKKGIAELEEHPEKSTEEQKAKKIRLKTLKDRVERALIALYQRDGFPLLHAGEFERPFLFFSSQNSYGSQPGDIRDLSSEALFSSSDARMSKKGWPIKKLQKFIRTPNKFDSINRLRYRIGRSQYMPWVDGIFQHTEIENSQITNFYKPDEFNDVTVDSFGGALQWVFDINKVVDLSFRSEYHYRDRRGLIEFLPDESEKANSFIGKSTISRFISFYKLNLNLTYSYDDIEQDVNDPIKRSKDIKAAEFVFQRYSEDAFGRLFDSRSWDFLAGVMSDREIWGGTSVIKNDYYWGFALRGLLDSPDNEAPFDITFRQTFLTYENSSDGYLSNAQYRYDLTFLHRLVNNENKVAIDLEDLYYLAFVNIVVPLSYENAIDGIDDFDNYKAGLKIDTKVIGLKLLGNTTFLASVR